MSLKLAVFACVALVGVVLAYPAPDYAGGAAGGAPAYGGGGGGGGGYGGGGYGDQGSDYQVPIDYNFRYDVKDDYTYNEQSREENKYGNVITGQYSLREPDGALRVVKYTADDYGFHATVDRQGGYGGGGGGGGGGYGGQQAQGGGGAYH